VTPSRKQQFFTLPSFAVVGDSAGWPFPRLTYRNLRALGREVYPVDLAGAAEIEGDPAFRSIADLPGPVAGAIVEVAPARTLEAVEQVIAGGVAALWLHMGTETPEALAACASAGIEPHTGGCAVMYTQRGFSFHSLHKAVVKLRGRY
jgi:hypothetical protein